MVKSHTDSLQRFPPDSGRKIANDGVEREEIIRKFQVEVLLADNLISISRPQIVLHESAGSMRKSCCRVQRSVVLISLRNPRRLGCV